MSCDDVRLELGGYVLGGLEPHERRAVEQHVASCGRCRTELAELAEMPALLATVGDASERAPADLKPRVLARLRRNRWRDAALVAASIVIAAFSGAGLATLADRPPAPDAEVVLASAVPADAAGDADLRQLPTGVRVDLDLTGLHAADEGYYHVWLHRGDYRVSAGTFVAATDRSARVQLLCGGSLEDYEQLSVTWHGADQADEVVALEAGLAT